MKKYNTCNKYIQNARNERLNSSTTRTHVLQETEVWDGMGKQFLEEASFQYPKK